MDKTPRVTGGSSKITQAERNRIHDLPNDIFERAFLDSLTACVKTYMFLDIS